MNILHLSDENLAEKFRRERSEQFYVLVRMHLSFVLDLHTDSNDCLSDKAKFKVWKHLFGKKSKTCGIMEGAPLTQEGICQVYQLIEYLKKETNIRVEGIFRRTGSLTRQQELRTLLNKGITLELESGQFSVHDCASVLKGFLSELPDPLLSEVHFPEYCQIAELCKIEEESMREAKLLQALQLILLLLPLENKVLLKDILNLLHFTTSFESDNRMCADSLATLFTPHLLCPRKLSPEQLHVNSQAFGGIIAFMIKNFEEVFKIPSKLVLDFRASYEKRKTVRPNNTQINESVSDQFAANTVFTFVDQERTAKENESDQTETALAHLYAYIQSLPESSKKRKLVKQFNKENGRGTPLQVIRSGVPKNKSLGDSIKKHILNKGLIRSSKKVGFSQLRSSSEEILNETMMTPRSRKPVLVVSGTNINALPKLELESFKMANLEEEISDELSEPYQLTVPNTSFKKFKSDGDIPCCSKNVTDIVLNYTEPKESLTYMFRDYLKSRDMFTPSSPADSSFCSRTDDFQSNELEDNSENKISESLICSLNGTDSNDVFSETGEKKLVLKPKQFDERGYPIVFETSF